MCRSAAQGGRRCNGHHGGGAGGGLSEADRKFFELRDAGYEGPIDRNGNAVVMESPEEMARRSSWYHANGPTVD